MSGALLVWFLELAGIYSAKKSAIKNIRDDPEELS